MQRLARKLQNISAKLPNLRDGELTSCVQTWIDSAPANVYALYKPLRVGSKCSSSYVRILIPCPAEAASGNNQRVILRPLLGTLPAPQQWNESWIPE
jgi:hypothetical protein